MTDPFESSKFSIAWAKEHHIAELDRKRDAFFAEEPHAAFTEPDTRDRTYNLVKLRLVKPLPRDLLGHTIDAINNLRSSLDQSIYAVRSTFGYFPIRNTKTEFMRDLRKLYLPKELARLISRFKPYKRGNKALWILNKLSGAHKHAIIRPFGMAHVMAGMRGRYRGPRPPQFPVNPKWNRAKNEVVIARVPADVKQFEMEYQSSFQIVFNDVQFVDGQPVVSILGDFVSITERIVMAIEAEARRLGLC